MARLTARDRQRYEQARQRGRRESRRLVAIVNARYDNVHDVVELVFRSGKVVAIPRTLLPGLKGARVSTLKAAPVSPAGDAISWRTKDIDFTSACADFSNVRENRASPRCVGNRAFRLDWRRPNATRLTPRTSSSTRAVGSLRRAAAAYLGRGYACVHDC